METLVGETKRETSSLFFTESKSELVRLLSSHPEAVVILDYTLSDFISVDDF